MKYKWKILFIYCGTKEVYFNCSIVYKIGSKFPFDECKQLYVLCHIQNIPKNYELIVNYKPDLQVVMT